MRPNYVPKLAANSNAHLPGRAVHAPLINAGLIDPDLSACQTVCHRRRRAGPGRSRAAMGRAGPHAEQGAVRLSVVVLAPQAAVAAGAADTRRVVVAFFDCHRDHGRLDHLATLAAVHHGSASSNQRC